MDWQEPVDKNGKERLHAVAKGGMCSSERNQKEAHSPRHLREAKLTVTIKIEHPELNAKKINSRIYQNAADTKQCL